MMKITKRQLKAIVEGYNSMSDAGRSLAARAKRHFHKDYPDVRVGINAMDGWIEVEGRKAVNMSSASGRPMSLEDVVDKMKQAYLGHPLQENKMKITKRQLQRIIKEASGTKLQEVEYYGDPLDDLTKEVMSILRSMDPMERSPRIYDIIDELENLAARG